MTYALAVTLVVLAGATALQVAGLLRADLVALLAAIVLGTTGVLSPQETFSGFSRSAVITILAVFILADGLERTGVTDALGRWIADTAGGREGRLVVLVMLAAATLSLVMNNIAAAAVLLPGVAAAGQRSGVSASRLLMPVAFGTLLGGMATLLTTSNIVVGSLLRDAGFEGFSLLDFAPIGLPLVAVGVVYMAVWGRRRLPALSLAERLPARSEDDLVELYRLEERLFRARVPPGSTLIGRPLAESTLRETYRLDVVAIERGGTTLPSPSADTVVAEGDVLVLQGDLADFRRRDVEPYLEILPSREWRDEDLGSERTVVVEAVLAPRSALVGKTLREAHFRSKHGMSVLAVWRAGGPRLDGLADLELELGDALLLQGPRRRIEVLRDEPDLILLHLERVARAPVPAGRRRLAVAITALTLVLAASGRLPTAEVMLGGALVLVLAGVLTMDQAYAAIEWRTVFLVAGMLPLGIAITKTGAAALLGKAVLAALGDLGPLAIVAGLFVLTALLVQAMTGPAVAAVMAPVAIETATASGLDPRAVAMAVALGTSMAFASPVGHPVNMLVMGSGGYRYGDYWRVGAPLTLLLFAVVLLLLPVFWPLAPG